MRSYLRLLLPALLLVSLLSDTAVAQTKVATVDLRKIFDNYWKRKQADAAIKERAAEMEKENASMMKDYNKAKEEYKTILEAANDQAVSTQEREKRRTAADEKLKQLKDREDTIAQYQKTARTTIEEQLNRVRENILGEIRTIISGKAQAGGYSLVLDTAAETKNSTPFVIYVNNNENDLTDAVLKQLNDTAPAATGAADAKKK
jgi:outer membrane protein